jgi:hypothetical protein
MHTSTPITQDPTAAARASTWWRIALAVCLLSLALVGLLQPSVP